MKWLKTLWDKSFTNWRYRLAAHVMFWAFLLFFWLQESMVVKINLYQHYSVTLAGIALSLFLFYPLVYLVLPLYQQKKYLWATVLFILYYLVAILVRTYNIAILVEWYNHKNAWFAGQDFWDNFYKTQLQPLRLSRLFFSSLSSLLEIIFIPLIIKFTRYAYKINADKAALEKDNVLLELNFLKAQLNPHFLFNTLNNLQSFIVHGESKQSIELLSRLASFLRSSLYECNTEYLALQKEADIIGNYINIERVRYDEQANICCAIDLADKSAQVPSLLFMPLVENAFTHSAALPAGEVDIQVGLQNNISHVCFTVSNRYYPLAESDNAGGIGLQNVRKRLEHYYPGKHTMLVSENSNIFTVNINIQQ